MKKILLKTPSDRKIYANMDKSIPDEIEITEEQYDTVIKSMAQINISIGTTKK